MSALLDNLIPLHGRTNHRQYAGWEPTRHAHEGLGCRLEADVRIPMPDGMSLSADVYRPKVAGKYPAIVQISAYNKDLHAAGMPKGTNEVGSPPVLTDRGYVQVLASRRGMGRSEGESGQFGCEQEIDDYVSAIAWAAEQPWCSGDVCLFGTSYYGLVQPLVAARKPPALRAMFMNEICTDLFRHLTHYGGSVNNRFLAVWLGANFKDSDYATRMEPWKRAAASQVINRPWLWERIVHPRIESIYESFLSKRPSRAMREWFARVVAEAKTRDALAMPEGSFRHLGEITTPFVVVHNPGQWNLHQFGGFDLFAGAATPAHRKFLILSEREYELPVLSWQLEALAFFDHVVKGCDNGYAEQPPVRYWLDGAQRYATARSFPAPEARRARLFLSADATLSADAPSAGSASWTAVPPSAPLPDGIDEVMVQKLTYSLACDRDVTLAGPVTVALSFSCNEIDSHLVAALSRVDREGGRHLLTMGAMRPAQRTVDPELSTAYEIALDTALSPLVPGEPVELRFSLVPAAARFASGERLLLEIASRTDLVKGKIAEGYVHFDLETPPYFSRNTVHHGPASYVEVLWE